MSKNESLKKKRKIEDFAFEKVSAKKVLSEDVDLHQRKSAWVAAYGKSRVTNCFVCQFNEVGWKNIGFDLAHVVARCRGGNNNQLWNRIPVCKTCNQNVSSDTNLFDFAAQNYPERIVPMALYLQRQFAQRQPHLTSEHGELQTLEWLVRFLFGSEKQCAVLIATHPSLLHFRQRCVTHNDNGAIQEEHVFTVLRAYDALQKKIEKKAKAIDSIKAHTTALQSLLAHLVKQLESEQEDLKTLEKQLEVQFSN